MAMVETENDSIQFGITQTQIICGKEKHVLLWLLFILFLMLCNMLIFFKKINNKKKNRKAKETQIINNKHKYINIWET